MLATEAGVDTTRLQVGVVTVADVLVLVQQTFNTGCIIVTSVAVGAHVGVSIVGSCDGYRIGCGSGGFL